MLPILEEGKGCYLFLKKGRNVTYSCRREGMLPILVVAGKAVDDNGDG